MRAVTVGLILAAAGCGSATPPASSGSGGAPGVDAGPGPGGVAPDAGVPVHPTHALAIRVSGGGLVRGGASDCSSTCMQQLDEGQTAHLVAIPQQDYQFAGWQGDCSGTGACDLTMSADRSVIATFFWASTVTVVPAGTGSGRLVSSPPGIDCPGSCAMTVDIGTPITLTATPDANSTFLGWGGACSGGTECNLNAYSDQTLWANFEAKGPPAVSRCAGVAALERPPIVQFVQKPWHQLPFTCGNATSDGSGTVALTVNGAHGDVVDFVSPSGTFLQGSSTSMDGFLLPQPAGFSQVSGRPYLGPEWAIQFGQLISAFDPAGNPTGSSRLANHSGQDTLPAAADPNGGVLFAGDLAMGPTDPIVHAAVMYQGGGTPAFVRWGPRSLASSGMVFGLGVDVLGRSLVITNGTPTFGAGRISAQWFDTDGTALTDEFMFLTNFTPGPATWFETTALVGGGLLVRRVDGGTHSSALALVDSGSAMVRPAPAWMASRRDSKMQIARGGKAYAVLPLGGKGVSCTQRVELVAPDGTSCGTTDFPIAGGTCDTFDLELGTDGTVIQRLPTVMEARNRVSGGQTCTWRWWPAVLR